jgi:TolB-like protein
LLLLSISGSLHAQSGITVAVFDFKNVSNSFSLDNLEQNVPEMLKTELSRSLYIQVLERSKLNGVLQELALGQTGLLDENAAMQVGELAGAEYIIQGQINRSGAGLRIDAHIVKVSSGRVVGEKVVGYSNESLDRMVDLLANNIIYDLTGNGNYINRMRLKSYPANYFLAATIVTGIAAAITHYKFKEEYRGYENATKLGEFDTFYDRAGNYRLSRNVLIGATGALAITTIALTAAGRSSSNFIVAYNNSETQIKLVINPCFSKDTIKIQAAFSF